MQRGSSVVVMMVLCLLFTGGSSSDETPAAAFRVEEARLDLGTVKSGSEAVAVFTFHNTGDKDVRIIRAKPS